MSVDHHRNAIDEIDKEKQFHDDLIAFAQRPKSRARFNTDTNLLNFLCQCIRYLIRQKHVNRTIRRIAHARQESHRKSVHTAARHLFQENVQLKEDIRRFFTNIQEINAQYVLLAVRKRDARPDNFTRESPI